MSAMLPLNAGLPANNSARYDRLLSILGKSLDQSREKIAGDATRTIEESYGDMTSLFSSSEDGDDGVSTLVDLLLGKLDSVHDRLKSKALSGFSSSWSSSSSSSTTRLEEILRRRDIFRVLQKVETAIEGVKREEIEFKEAEAADQKSAREAIKLAKSTRESPTSRKKRRLLPAESIGYHAHQLKLEYRQSLVKELEEIEAENEKLEGELKDNWGEWEKRVGEVKITLETLGELGGGGEGGDDGAEN
mmetsp:Transcript_34493/g.73456  ORF Transcript_34493/g.73456 Transcript_34493/m.73456 type:complete len:247 (-) Transcript_34493:149-889(-)